MTPLIAGRFFLNLLKQLCIMNGIIEWYSAIAPTEQVFWACAIIGSVIFLIQLVCTLIGMDASDVEVDFDGANTLDMGGGMSLFSVRALVNFLVGFGWAGVSLRPAISADVVLYVVSIAVGLFFAWLVMALMNKLLRLERNGAFSVSEAVGKTASVYLRIPAGCQGHGKVQVSIRGSVHEFPAVTDGEELRTGTMVKVVSVLEDSVLLVAQLQ